MKLNLVENGIFPIIYDKDNNRLGNDLDTGYNISGTIQGEGKLTGTTCLFIRTSACNLRCIFYSENGGSPCDTPYSSHKPEKNIMDVDDIVNTIENNNKNKNIKHIVISGGEPTMQTEALGDLLYKLTQLGYHTTIETNGTIFSKDFSRYVNLFSISPKLSNSNPIKERFRGNEIKNLNLEYNEKWATKHDKLRINYSVLQSMIDECYFDKLGGGKDYNDKIDYKDFQLKFVIATEQDLNEVKEIVGNLKGVQSKDVLLMPEGYYPEDIQKKSTMIIEKCIENGYTFSTRMHTLLFGTKRGV